MVKILVILFMMCVSCSMSQEDTVSSFGKAYAGTYIVTEGASDNEGARWLTQNIDSGLVAGSKITINQSGDIFFTKANGEKLDSQFEALNDGFFGSMASYYIILVSGDRPKAQQGKRFGISALRGWLSITDVTDIKPEGKPDKLFDITKP